MISDQNYDEPSFGEVRPESIARDHFSVSLDVKLKYLNYDRLDLCYYAYVPMRKFFPDYQVKYNNKQDPDFTEVGA